MTLSRSEAHRRAGPWPALVAAATALVATATAQAEVVVNEDQFRDWVGRCETETTTGDVICFIYTGRVAEVEGETLAARLVVGLGDDMTPIVYLDLPDTAEPAQGFMLQVDTREPFSGRFSNCSTGWCHTQAVGDVAQELIRQFRAGSQATASFILEGQELRVDIPLSLLGFTAAFTRLQDIHAQAAANTLENLEEAAEQEEEETAPDATEEAPTEGEDDAGDAAAPDSGDAPAEPAPEPPGADAPAGAEAGDPGAEDPDAEAAPQ